MELIINGYDAYERFGVKMGDEFLNNLTAPLSTKDYVENQSRLEHGKQVLLLDGNGNSIVKIAPRDVTLTFVLYGANHDDYLDKRRRFYEELENGLITIQVPKDSNDVYKLLYKGKPSSYGQNLARTMCKFAIKFEEPNPKDRG